MVPQILINLNFNQLKTIIFYFLLILLIHLHPSHILHAEVDKKTNQEARLKNKVLEFDANEVFYRRIIENNIFRPLGWQPEKVIFPYKLIGTIIYTNRQKKPTAIIQETFVDAAKKNYFVSTGDVIGNITVIDIQSKQVTLEKADKKIILNFTLKFLNPPRTVSSPFRVKPEQSFKKPSEVKNLRKDKKPSEVILDLSIDDIEKFKRNPPTSRNTFRLW